MGWFGCVECFCEYHEGPGHHSAIIAHGPDKVIIAKKDKNGDYLHKISFNLK